ncbi:hypothetical protein [Clostridium sp.]|uniref:hypothetical protein n=1 Tax=Clostridium sp. TaxID=1506 RepID=UPI0029143F9E|nr:hypothetical protein [Clostridium sp.]MDU5108009.1 hypothetical protein [Clostridium sp.]
MKWIENLFLTDDEIKILSIYLVYGVGVGVVLGLFFNNIELFFALGGVTSIIVSVLKVYINRSKKSKKLI